MKQLFGITALLLALAVVSFAQSPTKQETQPTPDITGLYSFVHEGEFVQIEVNDGKVSGLVSCFKSDDHETAEFVDQFFEQATLDGSKLSFRTKPTGGIWFEFSGTVERGPGKTPQDEGYWEIKGTLMERRSGADGKNLEKTRELTMRSFPKDADQMSAPSGKISKQDH